MNSAFRFLVPAAGVVIGILFGMTVGEVLIISVGKPIENVEFVCTSIGAILGYLVGYLVERQNR